MTRWIACILLIAALASGAATVQALDRKVADELYRQAILQHGNLDKTLARLNATADDGSKSARARADAMLMASDLLWRHGQAPQALEAVERALKIEESAEALIQKAQLLDAAGEMAQARTWYEKALPLTGAAEAVRVRLRLALMQGSSGDPKGLVELARSQDQAFRNRIAVVLAVLGYTREALDLFRVISTRNPERFQEQLRVTEWAIRTGDAKRAQAQAWEAAKATNVVSDQRYALSLLVEAHRLDETLPALIERFGAEKPLLAEARPVWIDLLREAGRYDEAIALVRGDDERRLTVDARHQLLRLYREAGRQDQVVAEYRKLIAAEPGRLDWPRGLAEHYAGGGDTAAAERIWREFLDRHAANAPLVIAGAEAAAQMGFDALAVEALEALIRRDSATPTVK
jgi:tetratricopeptide (TPR) repeat protein